MLLTVFLFFKLQNLCKEEKKKTSLVTSFICVEQKYKTTHLEVNTHLQNLDGE